MPAKKSASTVRAARSTRKRTFSLTPAQFRYRWVKALESGKYKQGRLVLHKINRDKTHEFCCLGVACDLYKKYGGRLSTRRIDTDSGFEVAYGRSEETAGLPEEVQDALGLSSYSGEFDATSLASENDRGKSFTEIAKIIKSKPEGLIAS